MINADIIRETAAWIEAHLTEELRVTGIAAKAGYSLHHFTRLFAGVIGASPKEYVLRRRLSEAAIYLARGKARVTDIAFTFGFNDLETFSRAFKREFGLTPGAVKRGATFHYYEPAAEQKKPGPTLDSSPLLEDFPACRLAGYIIRIGDNADAVGQLWRSFIDRAKALPNQTYPKRFLQLASWNEEEDNWINILVAAEMKSLDNIAIDLVGKVLPACRCLSFIHRGSAAGVSESYSRLYSELLPLLEIKPTLPFNFEVYYNDAGDPYADSYRFKICVPLTTL